MGYIVRRGRKWFAQVEILGIRQAKSHATKPEAMQWVLDLEAKIRKGVDTQGRTLGDLLERYWTEVTPRKKSAKNEGTRIRFLLRDDLAKVFLAELAPRHFAEWRDRRLLEVQGSTIVRDMHLLSAALHTARREWGWLKESPLTDVSRPKEPAPRGRIATDTEIAQLAIAAGYDGTPPITFTSRVIAAFCLATQTGMRGGEILRIRPGMIRAHSVLLPGEICKSGRGREVALNARAREILDLVCTLKLDPVFGLTDATKDALWRKLCKRAGITGLHFHDSRANFASWACHRLSQVALARQMGIQSLDLLSVYYRESAEDVAARL
jgi:integrase